MFVDKKNKKNLIFSFLYQCASFFIFMYIWSSFFLQFRAFSFFTLVKNVIYIILFIISELYVYSVEIEESRKVHRHFLGLIGCEILNEIARNLGGYLHVPGSHLKDIGFMLIPEFTNKLLARFGDVLSFIPFILMIFLVLSMDYKRMAQFITEQLRLFSIYYFVRACCEAMTILPGPAIHCRPGSTFNPPKDWIDIVSHMPVDGLSFTSCGDLIPSGHIGFVVLGLIAIIRYLPQRLSRYRRMIVMISFLYILVTCFFIIAYRKHYTVDLVVGFFLSFFISIVFKDGWMVSFYPVEPSYQPLPTDIHIDG